MKFKWKRLDNDHPVALKGTNGEYEARVYKHHSRCLYSLYVSRYIGQTNVASMEAGMWSSNGMREDHMLPTLKAAKQKAEEFAKQLSKLEI